MNHEPIRALVALGKLDEWLTQHPRGHAEILGDLNGRIFHLLNFDEQQAEQLASRTGIGRDTLSAMLAALEGE